MIATVTMIATGVIAAEDGVETAEVVTAVVVTEIVLAMVKPTQPPVF